MRKLISFGLFAVAIIVMSFVAASADTTPRQAPTEAGPMPTIAERIEALAAGTVSADDPAFYIILLQDPPLARYHGEIAGLDATSPAALGTSRLDTTSLASIAYLAHIDTQHADLLGAMEIAFARNVEVAGYYKYAMNGFAAWLTPQEAQAVASFPQVSLVEREELQHVQTDAGPEWIEAHKIWDGSASPAPENLATKGEGIVAGIIDTGINSINNPSFADTTDDGYVFANPRGQWYGLCAAPVQPCNNKLIGVWDFTGTTFEDDNNHGSHTASTTVGNEITITVDGNDGTFTSDFNVSGVAPRANLITYKVCIEVGCVNVSTGLGIDQAVADGVDVINYSIGGSSSNPWTNSGAQAYLAAFEANVLVAVAAGNDGPGPQTIGAPSNAPWVASVAATRHDRSLTNAITGFLDAEGNDLGFPDIPGTAYNSGVGPAEVVYAGDYLNAGDAALCEQPFAPLTFSGEIVICDRGVTARVEKCRNVELGGASGCILANDEANGDSTSADPHDVPSIHISYDNGLLIKQYLADNPGLQVSITATNIGSDPDSADILAGFSSRGPDASVADVLKPDIGAPGVDILAAYSVLNGNHGLLSGTSMASPHYAGALTLMHAIHPDWTVAEVRSALMLTSFNTPYDGGKETHIFLDSDGVNFGDPHDVGAGRVDLSRAALAGFVMNETGANFTAANPGSGGDPTTLNLASMSDGSCAGKCTWTRSLRSTQDSGVNWTASFTSTTGMTAEVTPSSFTMGPGGGQNICVIADVQGADTGSWAFGRVILTPDDPSIPVATMPIAALAQNGTGVGITCKEGTPPPSCVVNLDPLEVVTDPANDQNNPARPDTDVLSLAVAESSTGGPELFDFKLQVNGEPGPLPGTDTTWYIVFDYDGQNYYAALNIDNTTGSNTTTYDYGTWVSETGFTATSLGSAAGSFDADGLVTVSVPKSAFGSPPSASDLNNVDTRVFTGTPLVGLSDDSFDTPGSYTVRDATCVLIGLNVVESVTVDEGAGSAELDVALTQAAATTVTVSYMTQDSTAEAGKDYTATSGMLEFAPSEITKTVTIPILEDTTDELDEERFNLILSDADGAILDKSIGIITITDNDPLPTLSIADVDVDENAGSVDLTVTLTGSSDKTASVSYATSDGTAINGSDYTEITGTVQFAPGVTSQTITVDIIDDSEDDDDETFTVTLSGPTNSTLDTATATVSIIDDDSATTPTAVGLQAMRGAAVTLWWLPLLALLFAGTLVIYRRKNVG